MSNKSERERKEMANLLEDPKFMRKAWQAIGHSILRQPASKPVVQIDKDGNETRNSEIERYTYNTLADDLKKLGGEGERQPTELEMILGCQIAKARTDTQAAVFVRDTVGAKPVDESKLDAVVETGYESMSNEELELLAAVRDGRVQVVPMVPAADATTPCKMEDDK